MYVCACLHITCVQCSAHNGQKRLSGPLYWTSVHCVSPHGCWKWVLGPLRAQVFLTIEPSWPVLMWAHSDADSVPVEGDPGVQVLGPFC